MKTLLILFCLFASQISAQTTLNFDKRPIDCLEQWVIYPMNKDSTFSYGFIYLDTQAGLTLNLEGTFKISERGVFLPKKLETSSMKYRLQPNKIKIALIPKNKYAELQIEEIPFWLKSYQTDSSSVERFYSLGFLYNGWNDCAKALTYLEKAEKMDPKFKGLAVELAFSYNCLNLFDKAITILQKELKNNPSDAYVNKELIYAQLKLGNLDAAAESCKKAILVCTDKQYHAENCHNLLYHYFTAKNRTKFLEWLPEAKKWATPNTQYALNIKYFEENFDKQK